MSYKTELAETKAACKLVHDAEAQVKAGKEAAEHLPSHRLKAGERIRALYVVAKEAGKTKAEVATDLGYSASWIRELAGADTPEKVADAKAKAAARDKKREAKNVAAGKPERARRGSHGDDQPEVENDGADTGGPAINDDDDKTSADEAPITPPEDDPAPTDETEAQVFKVLDDYKEAWVTHCLPLLAKIRSIRSDARFDEIYHWYWFDVEKWMRDKWKAHAVATSNGAPDRTEKEPAGTAEAKPEHAAGNDRAELVAAPEAAAVAETEPPVPEISAGEVQARAKFVGAKIEYRGTEIILTLPDGARQLFDDLRSINVVLDPLVNEWMHKIGTPSRRAAGNGVDPETSADAMKARMAELDDTAVDLDVRSFAAGALDRTTPAAECARQQTEEEPPPSSSPPHKPKKRTAKEKGNGFDQSAAAPHITTKGIKTKAGVMAAATGGSDIADNLVAALDAGFDKLAAEVASRKPKKCAA